jgi:hypothetical protein
LVPEWLPRCNNLRVYVPTPYDSDAPFWRFSLPYHMQLEGRYQTVQFGPRLPKLQDLRKVTQRQLLDATRVALRERELAHQPDIATRARRYADTLARNPELTKTQLAQYLGISRIRLFQILSILKLPDSVLDFISAHDSPAHKTVLTERRLRPLTRMAQEAEQLARFRELSDCAVP